MEKFLLDQTFGTTVQNLRMDTLKKFPIPILSLEEQKKALIGLNRIKENIKNAQQIIENLNFPFLLSFIKPTRTKKLGEIASFEYGYTATASEQREFRYVRITDLDEYGNVSEKDKKYVNLLNKGEQERYTLKRGDIIVARIGSIGKTAIFQNKERAIFASYLIRIKLDKSEILPEYYWCFAQTQEY